MPETLQPTAEPQESHNKISEAQDRERRRLVREETLRQELEQVKSQYLEKENLIQKLLKNGWDINQLSNINAQSSQPRDPYINELENELNSTKQQINDLKEAINSRDQLNEIVDFIKQTDDYEYIKAFKLEKEVHNLIKHHYKEHKKVLSFDEAAKHIEQEIERLETERANVLKKTKKAQALYKFDVEDIKVKKSEGTPEKEIIKVIDKKPVMKRPVDEDATQPQRTRKVSQSQLIAEIAAKFGK